MCCVKKKEQPEGYSFVTGASSSLKSMLARVCSPHLSATLCAVEASDSTVAATSFTADAVVDTAWSRDVAVDVITLSMVYTSLIMWMEFHLEDEVPC